MPKERQECEALSWKSNSAIIFKRERYFKSIQQYIYSNQMYLIPLNQTIYYNATQVDYATLSAIYLLAFTYHPIYNYLLYLLYGISNGSYYTSFHLLVRNTDTNIFIQNQTLTEDFKCLVDCQIKVTESLLLIQSQHLIGIYTRNGIVKSPTHYQRIKITQSYVIKHINRYADIEFDRFVVVNANDNTLIFGRNNTNVIYEYPLNYIGTQTLDVHLTSDSLYLVAQPFWPQIYRFNCLLCFYNGSISNSLPIIPSSTFQQSSLTTSFDGFRLYQSDYHFNTSSITNGKVFFGFYSQQTSMGLLISATNSQVAHYYTNYEYYSFANQLDVFMFGRVNNLYHLKFDMSQSSAESYDFAGQIEQMAVNSDSTYMMVKQSGINWKAFQYQIVSNCSNYDASVNSFYPLFCNCHLYTANYRCSLIGSNITNNTNSTNITDITNNSTTDVTNSTVNTTNSTNNITNSRTNITNVTTNTINSTTSNNTQTNLTSTQNAESTASFPIVAVIGVVAGIVFLSISGIILKKNYKRCTKGRRRTPWKYEPIQLMSFEI